MSKYVSPKEAVRFFPYKISESTIRTYMKTGKHNVILHSENGKVSEDDVLNFIVQVQNQKGFGSKFVANVYAKRYKL